MSTSVCASCLSFSIDKIVKSQPTMKPTWLDKIDYVEEFIEKVTDFKIRKQKNYDTFLDLEIKNCANKKDSVLLLNLNLFMMYLQKMQKLHMVILRIMVLQSVMIKEILEFILNFHKYIVQYKKEKNTSNIPSSFTFCNIKS